MIRHLLSSFALTLGLAAAAPALAQTAPIPAGVPAPATPTDSLDIDEFGEFGDADGKNNQAYATQKVLYLSPTKLISVGYEAQPSFDITSNGMHALIVPVPGEATRPVERFGGVRLA